MTNVYRWLVILAALPSLAADVAAGNWAGLAVTWWIVALGCRLVGDCSDFSE